MGPYFELLRTYLGPYWRSSSVLAVLVFSNIGLTLVNPMLLGFFVDSAADRAGVNALLSIASLFIGIAVLNQALVAVASYLSENLSWLATNRLRVDLVEHCVGLDMSFHKETSPGSLIERVDGDVTTLAEFFSNFLFNIAGNLVLVFGIIGLSFVVDWRIGLVLLGFTIVSTFVLRYTQGLAVSRMGQVRASRAEISGYVEESISAREDVVGVGAQARVGTKLDALLDTFRKRLTLSGPAARASSSALEIAVAMATASILALGAFLLAGGAISLGTVYTGYSFANLLSMTLFRVSYRMDLLQVALAGIQRITALYYTKSALPEKNERVLPPGALDIRFEDVHFSYTPENRTLTDISFSVRPGETVGLLGHTGSGKTTVSRLIYRGYDVVDGRVLLGGVDIRDVELSGLHQRIGVVTQDVQIFHGTVRENLTLFQSGKSDAEIEASIEELGLLPWYHGLPEKLDTVVVGERLSAGEAQLLAFGRVFLRDPDILILDEASSRLDPSTERIVEDAVTRLLHGRTAIVIAHRLNTVQRLDRIMVMEDGKILESGRTSELAANPDSKFAALLSRGCE